MNERKKSLTPIHRRFFVFKYKQFIFFGHTNNHQFYIPHPIHYSYNNNTQKRTTMSWTAPCPSRQAQPIISVRVSVSIMRSTFFYYWQFANRDRWPKTPAILHVASNSLPAVFLIEHIKHKTDCCKQFNGINCMRFLSMSGEWLARSDRQQAAPTVVWLYESWRIVVWLCYYNI
jgi:hypothetical protein